METNSIIDPAAMPLGPGTDAWELVNCETRANDLAAAVAAAAGATATTDGFNAPTSPPQHGQGLEDFMKRSVLRDELRVNILQRRWQKGLGSLQLDWKLCKTDKLTPEEMDKRKVRRERNRIAASRCRERRRERTYVLVQETDELESRNQELVNEIQQLETERQELFSFLESHHQTCGYSPPVLASAMQELHIDPE